MPATSPKLTHFKALVFDVYGTLCDWEEGIYQALLPVLTRANSRFSRDEALVAFSAVEERLQKAHPQMLYADLLTKVHEELSQELVATTPSLTFSQEDHIAFGRSIKDWPIFPDSTDALAYLSTQYKLVVLFNVDRSSFSFTQAKLEAGKFSFDQVCTAQDIGSYKPNPKNFEYALRVIKETYGIEKDQVLSTAQSLHHDHVPAQALGMSSAWIDRDGASMGFDVKPNYNFRFKTLGEMAEAVRQELA